VLGEDVLLLARLSGRESVGSLFEFDLELASETGTIDFRTIVGSSLTIAMTLEAGGSRYVNGIVSRFAQGSADERFVYYKAQIVPQMWLLTRRANCRIFQDMSVPEIIKKIFGERGLEVKDSLSGSYSPRVYCVQYRETDYAFACRLMEESGISFYFTHEQKRHMLVLFDAPSGNVKCVQPEAMYAGATSLLRVGNVWSWTAEREIGPGAYAITDYDFEKPGLDLGVNTSTSDPIGGNAVLEIYDPPGEYTAIADGERLVKVRMEAEEAASIVATGSSDCAGFCPGTHFALRGHYRGDHNVAYLLTQVTHEVEQSLTGDGDTPSTYENTFTCIPYSVPWRPKQVTSRPRVHGLQTAVVVGPAGEEIYVDKYGRVKVQFHWDREGKRDEKSSCWIRVSQVWAGKTWGGIFHPRIGQEVIVEFEEGDPDRPLVTGRVYNADMMPPYDLPANATQSGIKSRSSKSGSPSTFNEIRFEDKKGSELFYIHAEKDREKLVENDERSEIGHDRKRLVKNDETVQVDHDRSVKVKNNHVEDIGVNQSLKIGGSQKIDVTANIDEKAGANITIEAGGVLKLTAGGSTIKISAAGIDITTPAIVKVNGALVKIN
jgi:type VI secretion system secreted protein VgrG